MAILPFLLLVLGFLKQILLLVVVLLKHHNQTDNKWHNKVDGVGNPTFALYRFKNHAYCHKTAQKCAHNTNCYTVPRYINWVLRYFPNFHNGACQYHRNGKQKGKLFFFLLQLIFQYLANENPICLTPFQHLKLDESPQYDYFSKTPT